MVYVCEVHCELKTKTENWWTIKTIDRCTLVVNNIYDHPITVGGGALGLGNLLLHHQVAARVEANAALVGAVHLDMAPVHVGRVDEGAGIS